MRGLVPRTPAGTVVFLVNRPSPSTLPERDRRLIGSRRGQTARVDVPPRRVETTVLVVTIVGGVVDDHRLGHRAGAAVERNRDHEASGLQQLLLLEREALEAGSPADADTAARRSSAPAPTSPGGRWSSSRNAPHRPPPSASRRPGRSQQWAIRLDLGRVGVGGEDLAERAVVVGVAVTEALRLVSKTTRRRCRRSSRPASRRCRTACRCSSSSTRRGWHRSSAASNAMLVPCAVCANPSRHRPERSRGAHASCR